MTATREDDVLDLPRTQEGAALVVVETPRGSGNKLKYDPELGAFKLDRVLPAGMTFPFDFGFLPQTVAEDGDPLDVIVLLNSPAFPGCVVPARLIGNIEARQKGAGTHDWKRNDRLLAVAEASRAHASVRSIRDLDPFIVEIDRRLLRRLSPARRRRVRGHGEERHPGGRARGTRRQRYVSGAPERERHRFQGPMTGPGRGTRGGGPGDDPRSAIALWPEAGAAALSTFAEELGHRAKQIGKKADPDPVHDMRTATRRMRTAATIYRSVFPNRDLRRLEDELRRVAHRLGATRDLDVMLEMLGEPRNGDAAKADGTAPLRRAWTRERDQEADRLRSELDRRRFGRSLERAARLAEDARSSAAGGQAPGDDKEPTQRVAHRAPSTIWKSFGEVLAYDLDARTADPDDIHQMRIAAKGLRYTLEAFEDSVGRGLKTLIEEVTALQDAAGEMHDAIVAAQRARELIERDGLQGADLEAIERFATEQDERAAALRPEIHRRFETVRSPPFRRSLGNAVVALAGKGVRPPLV